MRVLQVVEASGGGVGRHVLDLVAGLHGEGHDVHLLYSPLRSDAIFRSRLAALGTPVAEIPIPSRIGHGDLTAARRVRSYLAAHRPFDVVHGHSSKAGGVVRLAALGTRSRVVYTPHAFAAMSAPPNGARARFLGLMERAQALATDAIICVSPEELEFARSLGIAPHRLHLVPSTIGTLRLPPRDAARRIAGLAEHDVAIGFVGRFCVEKAPDLLVAAFDVVRRVRPDAVLVVVGDGEMAPELYRLSEHLGLDGAVRWLGAVEGRDLLPAFDLVAIPSRSEGLPYIALEALEAGLPIVATTRAGCRLLVEDGVNGRLVPPEDPDALGRAVINALSSPERLARWGQASAARSREHNRRPMVKGTLNVYTG